MGMDVVGVRPSAEVGKYFRNNVWWWHPLWGYCNEVAPQICAPCEGTSNDGDGLPAARAETLADLLEKSVEDGRCLAHQNEFEAWKRSLAAEDCAWCQATGVRRDEVGVNHGMDVQVLSEEQAEQLGRRTGWCNSCRGTGKTEPHGAWYFFDVENVENFIAFLRHCGGFKIW